LDPLTKRHFLAFQVKRAGRCFLFLELLKRGISSETREKRSSTYVSPIHPAMTLSRSSIISLVLAILMGAVAMAGAAGKDGAATYLVYVDPAPPGVASQIHQLGILAAALGG
jgi:hypothetical protein